MEEQALKKQLGAAAKCALPPLALNYYTFYEIMSEHLEVPEILRGLTDRFNGLLQRFLDGEEIEAELLDLRGQVEHHVEALTDYTAYFDIYGSVLDKMKYRFHPMPDLEYDDDACVDLLLRFAGDTDDAAVMNFRVSQILGCLPVRFTKQKFFELVRVSLLPYVGGSKDNFGHMLQMIRNESMDELHEDMGALYPELYELLERFRTTDFKQMPPEVYEELSAAKAHADEKISDDSGIYLILENIINNLYVLVLARQEDVLELSGNAAAVLIIKGVLENFLSGGEENLLKELEEKMVLLEGRQEKEYERYLRLCPPDPSPQLAGDPLYKKTVLADRLLSGSLFADLEVSFYAEEEVLDQADFDREVESLFTELSAVFSAHPRPVVRAVMARLLSDLPIVFQSAQELDDHIRGSLKACSDEAEKGACKLALLGFMEEEYALV